jgi:uncharacterized membrane-anchored protein
VRTKEEIVAEVREALAVGVLSTADILALTPHVSQTSVTVTNDAPEATAKDKPDKLSAVDVMFYVAGIVLFSAIISFIVQSWSDGNALLHIFLSAGIGLMLWAVALYLARVSVQTDIRKGLFHSLLVTGSLLLVSGGYIVLNEVVLGYNELNLTGAAITLAILSAVHLGFDRMVKREFTLLMGIVLGVAAFPVLVFGFLRDSGAAPDVYAIIMIISALVLAYATRVAAKVYPERRQFRGSFDALAAFLALGTMYAVSFGDYGTIWLIALVLSVFGLYYLSIVTQSKQLLGNASFFLILTVITIAFKYFSSYGVTTSLVLSAVGLLGSAAVASSINKKYFKPPTPATPPAAKA